MEVRLCDGRVRLIGEVPDTPRPQQTTGGVDVGVHPRSAATEGQNASLISGRAAKATVQERKQQVARVSLARSGPGNGSHRQQRGQRRTHRMLGKRARRIRDLCHQATRQVAAAFPHATCDVGELCADAAQRAGRVRAQPGRTARTRKLSAERSLSLADVSRMRAAEQEAQDRPLSLVWGQPPARCCGGGQYAVARRARRHASRPIPATAGEVSAPLASPAAR
jgi:hypothetical protein